MLHIRDARPEEHDLIRDLTLRAYAEYARTMTPEAWVGLQRAVMDGLANLAEKGCIVAERDGQLVGSVLLYKAGVAAYGAEWSAVTMHPEVRLLAVPPEARGLGVARALMSECIRRAREAGSPFLGLHTSRSMRAALALYQTMGFERATELDFTVEGSELVEGYRLPLTRS
jgi:ribosomal protein S18 acetylase RimI-like enzyme